MKWFLKQFLYGQVYLWLKPRLGGIILALLIIFLIFYAHSEYLKYVEFKDKSSTGYIGLSFIIKNSLILFKKQFHCYKALTTVVTNFLFLAPKLPPSSVVQGGS